MIVKELIKLANHLDNKGFVKEADYLDAIIKKAFQPNPSGNKIKRGRNFYYFKVKASRKNLENAKMEVKDHIIADMRSIIAEHVRVYGKESKVMPNGRRVMRPIMHLFSPDLLGQDKVSSNYKKVTEDFQRTMKSGAEEYLGFEIKVSRNLDPRDGGKGLDHIVEGRIPIAQINSKLSQMLEMWNSFDLHLPADKREDVYKSENWHKYHGSTPDKKKKK